MTRRFSDAVARDGRRLRRGFCISSDRIQCRFDYGPGRSNRFVVEIAKNADLLPVIAAKFTRRCFRTADEVEQKRPDAGAFLRGEEGVEPDAAVIRDFPREQSGMRSCSHAGKRCGWSAMVGEGTRAHTRFASFGMAKAQGPTQKLNEMETQGAMPNLRQPKRPLGSRAKLALARPDGPEADRQLLDSAVTIATVRPAWTKVEN